MVDPQAPARGDPHEEPQDPDTGPLLGRELIIRYMGILFAVSPIGNFVLSAILSGVRQWWRWTQLKQFAVQMNPTFWLLSAANVYAGFLMMKGKRDSWLPTLSVIAITLIFNGMTFRQDFHDGWLQPVLSVAINLGLFGLIYSQEFHQRVQRRLYEAQLKRPFAQAFSRPPTAELEGAGDWGRITHMTHQGFQVSAHAGRVPPGIEERELEIELGNGTVLRARFQERIGNDYVFKFTSLTPPMLAATRRWARTTGATRHPRRKAA